MLQMLRLDGVLEMLFFSAAKRLWQNQSIALVTLKKRFDL
jgi:hypothetical protein